MLEYFIAGVPMEDLPSYERGYEHAKEREPSKIYLGSVYKFGIFILSIIKKIKI